jgi:hypothetical protein
MPTPSIEESIANSGAAILSSENIAIATLGLMLLLSIIANIVQYKDYRADRAKPWKFVHDLTETLQDIRVTIAGLGK